MALHQITRTYEPPAGSRERPANVRITYHAEPGRIGFLNEQMGVGSKDYPTEVTFYDAEVEVGIGEFKSAPLGLMWWAEQYVEDHANELALVEPPTRAWADPVVQASL